MSKSAAYIYTVAWIILCKNCKFYAENYYDYGDNKFFIRDCFFYWRILYMYIVVSRREPNCT